MAAALERLEQAWKPGTPAIVPELFVDPELYELELRRIFCGPVWHMVGHRSEFPRDGDFKTHRIGDVPVVITRVGESYHALVNTCAHRGSQVVRASRGNAKDAGAFTCIYHQWSYDAKGQVISVGLNRGYGEDFKPGEHSLPRGRTAVIGGLVFASLHPSPPPIEEYLGPTIAAALGRLFGSPALRYYGVQRAELQCNWKVYVENIYDSYHAVTLHKAFRLMRLRKPAPQLLDEAIAKYGHYISEFEADFPGESGLANPQLFHTLTRENNAHFIGNVFPAAQIVGQLDVLAIRAVVPRGPLATEVHFHCFGYHGDDAATEEHRLWQSSNVFGPQGIVNLEDVSALARMQEAIHGRSPHLDRLATRRFPERRADEKALDMFYGTYRRLLFS
jgi:anthranilate 1,2-dioxygenase large subunit